ncbi:MAG: glycosyltransferase family 2 protein [Bacteroidetes bacterium]|nr:glycosyltransferase family 2 protein [Bacteroidota bacterium]
MKKDLGHMTRPLLSICIATFNRADFISETLESIIPQLTNEVEVVIVDGASTDNTGDIVSAYLKNSEQIRYIRLSEKGGVDHDYCKCVEFAIGKMCWLFTDDDLLLPDGISTVLTEIKKNYSLIVVNSRVMTADFSSRLSERQIKINENKIFSEAELGKLFSEVITYLSFIGAVVINRELWLEREKERYFGTEFIHVGVIFQLPLPCKTLVIADPHIGIRYGNAQWSKRAFNIGMIKWPRLLSSFENINDEEKKPFTLPTPFSIWRNMLFYRSKGQYTLADFEMYLKFKKDSISNKSVGMLIAVIPSIILNVMILIYLKTFRRSNLIAIYDLEKFNSSFFSKFRCLRRS